MKTTTRFLVMIGAGLAVATIGAAPAHAAPAAPEAATTASVQARPDRDEVEDYFRTRSACERAGRFGEWRNRWEDYDCDFVRRGPHRGMWALEVERDRDWHHDRDRDRDRDRDDDDRGGRR